MAISGALEGRDGSGGEDGMFDSEEAAGAGSEAGP